MAFEVRVTEAFDIEATMRQASKAAALKMADLAYEGSQEEVPVRTGKLKRSGRVEKMTGPNARVVYGGPGVDYAAVVHNKPGVRYRTGKWQYLRDPLMRARQMLAAAAVAYRQALKGTL